MFWIKTQDGNLCNLALATDIRLKVPGGLETAYRVAAHFPGDDGLTVLGAFDDKSAAEAYRSIIAEIVGVKESVSLAKSGIRQDKPAELLAPAAA